MVAAVQPHPGRSALPSTLTSSLSSQPLYLTSALGLVTSHCCSSESTSSVAATDGTGTEDTEAIALETKERLFIDVSRGLVKLRVG